MYRFRSELEYLPKPVKVTDNNRDTILQHNVELQHIVSILHASWHLQ
jgi:hypothetical protein